MVQSESQGDFRRADLEGMDPERLLAEAAVAGLTIQAEGERLVVRGPRDAEQDLVQALLRRKAALLPLRTFAGPEEREYFEERAAIAEYDGGLSRPQAELQAWQEVRALWRKDHAPSDDAGRRGEGT
jgi:hypothetical protein